jgi:quercetin dioxygenase-like cupin family protein
MTVLTIAAKIKRNIRTLQILALVGVTTTACASSQVASNSVTAKPAAEPNNKVILVSQVKWEKLNPARGDKSPQAGSLWGDRKDTVPTGFLTRFVDGFSSPPHIHNVTYRAVVISGLIHNDDPDAAHMWMPAGSFWTQPKGEVHITAAKGATNIALVEIDKGPYLVLPVEEAFDSGERPINVDASNIVWVDPPGIQVSANGPKVAYLWGNPQDDQLNGIFVKLPAGFVGKIHSHGSTFRAVVIKGQPQYQVSEKDIKTLVPGSYFSSKGESVHQISSNAGVESIIYVRTDGKYGVIQAQHRS